MDNLRFLLEHVIKVEILRYSENLAKFNLNEIFEQLEQLIENISDPTLKPEDQYNQLFSPAIFGLTLPKKFDGKAMSETLGLLFFAEIAKVNAHLGFELCQGLSCCQLLIQHNEDGRFDETIRKMVRGKLQGILELLDPHSNIVGQDAALTAEFKDGKYILEGNRTLFFTPSLHDKIFIVSAQTATGKKLFLVEEEGLRVNTIGTQQYFQPANVEFAPHANAQLICNIDNLDFLYTSGMRRHLTLLAYSLVDQSFERACAHSRKTLIQNNWHQDKQEKAEVFMTEHPTIIDSLLTMKSYRDGLQAMIYHTAFYNDCAAHGAKDKQDYFLGLTSLFTSLFKYYTPKKAIHVKNIGAQILGPEYFLLEDQNIFYHANLLGGNPMEIVNELVLDGIQNPENKQIDYLMQEFGTIEAHQAKSEDLKEAIQHWKDFVGGLFVIHAELTDPAKKQDQNRIFTIAKRVAELLADVSLAFFLIKEALEAERCLGEKGANFYNLEQDVAVNPEFHEYYNRIISANHFCQSSLLMQNSKIEFIQQSKPISLNAIF